MENYGFVLLTKQEMKKMNISESTGMFNVLYANMERDIKRNKNHFKDHPYSKELYSFKMDGLCSS